MPWMLFLYFPRGLMSDLTTLYQSSFIPSFIEHTYVEQLLWVGIVLDSKNIDVSKLGMREAGGTICID